MTENTQAPEILEIRCAHCQELISETVHGQWIDASKSVTCQKAPDRVHHPLDIETELADILDRITGGFLKTLDIGDGWKPLVALANAALRLLDPEYTVQQVKEKFGGLRYYATPSANVRLQDQAYADFRAVIEVAEAASRRTCEDCGQPGTLQQVGKYWVHTLCRDDLKKAIDRQAEMRKELNKK